MRHLAALILILLIATGCGSTAARGPARPDIILATTTSTQDSGLLDVLVPMFEKQTGYRVKTIAVGTGQALAMGEKGEADVLLVHSPADEKKLVEKGFATDRKLVMHNDYVLVGPTEDPAKVKSTMAAADAMKKIADSQAIFVSRGDDSGTYKKELSLWTTAKVKAEGKWYQQTGQGMGQTLNVANEKKGYTLTDRATYLANKKNLTLQILLEGDAPLLNIYHVMLVNAEKWPKVNLEGARAFHAFMLSQDGQETIGKFGADKYGQALFFPDGGRTEAQLTATK